MKEQNYSNHKQYVFGYHVITFSLAVILLFISLYNVYHSIQSDSGVLTSIMFLIIAILFLFLFLYARVFALRAQDRAIKAEENFRHYILTGKVFDSKLSISQILALRFASDEEFTELTNKAISENLKAEDIKKAIKNWKADNYRV